jgi:hypothetical protein
VASIPGKSDKTRRNVVQAAGKDDFLTPGLAEDDDSEMTGTAQKRDGLSDANLIVQRTNSQENTTRANLEIAPPVQSLAISQEDFEAIEAELPARRIATETDALSTRRMQVEWSTQISGTAIPGMKEQTDPCSGVWSISGFLAPSLGTRRIEVPSDRPQVLRDRLLQQERPVAQLGFGVSLERKLSTRWSVSSGIEYNSYVVETSGRHQVRFTRFGERLNDRGNFENTLDLNLNTSYGALDAAVIIERSAASVIDEHRFINVDLEARQSMRVLQIPVSLKYHFPIGGLTGTVHGGVSGNVLMQDRFESSVIRSTHSDVLNIRIADRTNISGTRKLALGYQLGIGIEKSLNCHWAILIEPTLSGYIQPVYQHEVLSVYPTQLDVHVGVQYKW